MASQSRKKTGTMQWLLACSALAIITCSTAFSDKKGVINLDTLTFDKLIGEDRPVVVAFTDQHPYGDEWEAFTEAAVASWTAHILFAQVALGVPEDDYGYGYGMEEENDNDKLASRYRAEPGDILFFPKRQRTPTKWHSEGKDKSELLLWIKGQGVYVGLEGCLKEFDELTIRFMTQSGDRVKILEEAEAAVATLKASSAEEDQAALVQAVVYTSIMKKVLKSGEAFIQSEKDRVGKMVEDGAIKEEKKHQFRKKLNILETFEPSPEDREPVDKIDFDEDEQEF